MNMLTLIKKLEDQPHISLGKFPTPIRKINLSERQSFYIKDDGVCSNVYGGNKVRKLEYLLADAKKKGKRRLIVYGDTNSHTVQACIRHGRRLNFEVAAVVFPFKEQPDSLDQIKSISDIGVRVYVKNNMISTIIKTFILKLNKENYRIPLGCTTPLSNLGYVKAGLEFGQQIEKGEIKSVKKIYIAYGSGGTVAGLLIGLALLKSSIEVVAVQTVDSVIANERRLRQLVAKSLSLLDCKRTFLPEVMNRLDGIESGYLGKGYRDITFKGKQAIEKLSAQGLELEPIQTGKVMAALLDDLSGSAPGSLLFWNTHHQEAMKEGDNYVT